MEFKVLAVGAVVGNPGMDRIRRSLRQMKRKYNADFVVVNGENAGQICSPERWKHQRGYQRSYSKRVRVMRKWCWLICWLIWRGYRGNGGILLPELQQQKSPETVVFQGFKRRSRDLNPGCHHWHYSLSRGYLKSCKSTLSGAMWVTSE